LPTRSRRLDGHSGYPAALLPRRGTDRVLGEPGPALPLHGRRPEALRDERRLGVALQRAHAARLAPLGGVSPEPQVTAVRSWFARATAPSQRALGLTVRSCVVRSTATSPNVGR